MVVKYITARQPYSKSLITPLVIAILEILIDLKKKIDKIKHFYEDCVLIEFT